MDIVCVLSRFYRDQKWSIRGNRYESINWRETNSLPKPTLEEIEEKWNEYVAVQPLEELRAERDTILSQTDKYATIDFPHGSEAAKQAWLDYRQALRDLPANTDPSNPTWPIAPGAEFPELKARLQTIETQANTAIEILSDFGISGLMDPITTTWPAKATSAVLDARLKPIETGATGARAILDLFGVDDLPEFTVDDTSTIESRLTALETAGAAAQQTLQAFGIDI